jgi:hypothetical protein
MIRYPAPPSFPLNGPWCASTVRGPVSAMRPFSAMIAPSAITAGSPSVTT